MRRSSVCALLLAAIMAAPPPAAAHSYTHGALHIGHPWAQPSDGPDGAAFFAGVNRDDVTERLVAASTPVARAVVFRAPREQVEAPEGIFGRIIAAIRGFWAADDPFAEVDTLAFPPGRPRPMRPGGTHLALIELERPLREGDRFALTLVFAESGPITVEVHVEQMPGQ